MGNEIKFYNSDCLAETNETPDHSVDLILTDPLFGTTSLHCDKILYFNKLTIY
jgi:hypothetical protein